MNPSKILDSIGRILTPVFAIMIVMVIVAGALKYGGHSPQVASQAYQASAFGKGLLGRLQHLGCLGFCGLQCSGSSHPQPIRL